MSGGRFDYDQYKISSIADEIEHLIYHNGSEELNEWGDKKYYTFTPETIEKFKEAVELLNKAFVYAHRVDYLLSGDDGEDSFHERLKDELEKLNG